MDEPMQQANNPRTKFSVKWNLVLSILAIIIALGALVFAWINAQQKNQLTTSTQFQQWKQMVVAQMQANQQVLQTQIQDQQKILLTIQNNQATFARYSQQRQNVLSQIAYLIHLANLYLSIEQNAKMSLQLLITAQQQLTAIDDANLFLLKRNLARDIARLQTVPPVNATQLLIQLDTINDAVQQLVLPNKQFLSTTTSINNKKLSWYQQMLQDFAMTLKDLVVIRDSRKPVIAKLSAEQEIFAKHNIQFKILLAQWAVVHQDANLYKNSLNTAQNWLKTYFAESAIANNLSDKIAALAQININPPLPHIEDSLEAINEIAKTMSAAPPIKSSILPQNQDGQTSPPANIPTLPKKAPRQGIAI